jgi:acetyltransferase
MKAGRTAEGAKAASSHTGGIAKEDLATDLIFEKTGIVSFRDEGELCHGAVAFATQPIPQGNRVGIITNTGGPAVIATDVFVNAGLALPPLSEKTKQILTKALYPEASVNNPVDVLATGTAAHYRACMDAMLADDAFDCLYINFVTPFFVDTESIAKEIAAVNQLQKKPMVVNLMTDKRQWSQTLKILQDAGVPCFSLPGEGARALASLVKYQQVRARDLGEVKLFDDVDADKGRSILARAQQAGVKNLTASDIYTLLSAYGIPVAAWRVVNTTDEAEKALAQIGLPVAVKVESDAINHKSDMGGVAIDLKDATAVRSAVEEMQKRLDTKDLKFLIQRYLPDGRELIVGAKAEEGLGHLIMFGLGGIYVEVLKDVVFKLTPVTTAEAHEMLSSIQAAPLLGGVRGENGIYQTGVIEIIQRLSQLLTDLPAIQEMDLNPIIAYEDQVFVVDARISL